ncbi:MAG TPA: VOC family protein [Calditrichia bacterium]|nr:VOC family protein [Calditrichota bacterium]HQV30854.1 VOC family protein [Calditrichia bacterium]
MFKVTKTQHVLAVNDLAASEKFYVGMLGFEVNFRVEGWCFLNLDNFYLMLGHCAGDLLASETNNHSYFAYVNCEGIDDLYETYRSRGVQFTQPLANKPWGQREFGVVTPEGHRIMFGQTI